MSKIKDNLRVEKEKSKRRNPWRSDAEKSCITSNEDWEA